MNEPDLNEQRIRIILRDEIKSYDSARAEASRGRARPAMMETVPNKPKTPLRNVRIDDQLWGDAKIVAAQNDTNVSEVVRHALWKFILENDRGPDYTETYRIG